MNLFDKFLKVFDTLEAEGVDYILIGGFAIILHGFPRLTQDIDILVKMTESNIHKLQKALFRVFADPEVNKITCDDLKKFAVIRYGSPDGFHIDLMAKVGEIDTFETIKYELLQVEGVTVKTATPESLYQLKKGSIRPEDQRDILFLDRLLKNRKNKK